MAWPTWLPEPAFGISGMVASPHYLATLAGLDVLKAGGHAVDAAVAANAVLQVVMPHMCGPGGDGFWMIYDATANRLVGLNASGTAPALATPGEMAHRRLEAMPIRGILSVTVPGCVAGWAAVLERYGRRELSTLLAPAVRYASRGFPATAKLCRAIREDQHVLRSSPSLSAALLPGGHIPAAGELLRLPELGNTLELIGKEGAAVFYRGVVAERLASYAESKGGLLRATDLAGFAPEWVSPLRTVYRHVEVCEMPPNSQGATALLALNLVTHLPLTEHPPLSDGWVHLLVEAKRLAFEARDNLLGDPRQAAIPIARFTDRVEAKRLQRRIDPQLAGAPRPLIPDRGDTVYLCVVDRDHNAVSMIQSLFHSFGSGEVAEGTGIILHNRGSYFSLDPASPNCLAPGKRPLHTLMPAMVLDQGRPAVVIGTAGGDGQAQTHLQLLTDILDAGMDVQQAIQAPRWFSGGVPSLPEEVLLLEERFPAQVRDGLARRGHRVAMVEAWDMRMGRAQAISIAPDGLLAGAADLRGDGLAAGY